LELFERVRRLFAADQVDSYVAKVATALLREGFDAADLDELDSAATFERTGRMLQVLREKQLPAEDAAHAIRLAAGLYHKTKHIAEKSGWPLKAEVGAEGGDVPRNEAYFLELLQEAAAALRFRP
jgi:hypothetical protein